MTWDELEDLGLNWDELSLLGITWDDLDGMSARSLLEIAQAELDRYMPQNLPSPDREALNGLKTAVSAILLNVVSAVLYDSLKGIDWPSVLRSVIGFIASHPLK